MTRAPVPPGDASLGLRACRLRRGSGLVPTRNASEAGHSGNSGRDAVDPGRVQDSRIETRDLTTKAEKELRAEIRRRSSNGCARHIGLEGADKLRYISPRSAFLKGAPNFPGRHETLYWTGITGRPKTASPLDFFRDQ